MTNLPVSTSSTKSNEKIYRLVAEAIIRSTHLLVTAGNILKIHADNIANPTWHGLQVLDFLLTADYRSIMTLPKFLPT
jgi:hypothetical protein